MVDRHYPRAPITEAIIDLQVLFESPPSESDFAGSIEKLHGRFPDSRPINFLEWNVGALAPDTPPTVTSGPLQIGVRLATAQQSRVLQIKRQGFTYSHMAPYSDWHTFSAEARELWSIFLQDYQPQVVTRAAVRYINRIVVPAEKVEFGKYFLLYPMMPPGIQQDLTGSYMQLAMPQPDIAVDAGAVLNFALEPNAAPGSLSFLLDVDVFSTCRFSPDSADIWSILERFRTRKNEIFEACITDDARELFL